MAVNPNIKITADTSQAERAIKALDAALGDLQDQTASMAKFFGALTAAAATVGYAINKTLDSAGQLIDAANALGVSAQELSYLQKSAELAGIGADQLNASLIKLSRNIGDALIKGGDQATAAFTRLGIPLQQLAGMNPAQQFEAITQALNEIPDRATRSALAVELLGKQGPMLLAAAENTKRLKQEMADLGLALSDFDVQALDAAGDSLTELKQIFDAALKKAVAEIAPYIVAIVKAIKDAIKEAGGFEVIWGQIKEAIHSVVNIALILAGILTARLVVGAAAFVVQLVRAQGVMKGIAMLMARTPIGLLAAGAAILADKLGIDVVGALGDSVDLSRYISEAQSEINQKVLDQRAALEGNNGEMQQFTEEQQKALKALEDTATQLRNQNSYLTDILNLGQQEADVRKLIRDEAEKLKKVGLEMTPQQEQMLRLLKEEEATIKRLTTLRQEQAQIAFELFVPTDPINKEFNKLIDVRSQFERGLTNQQIQEETKRQILQAKSTEQIISMQRQRLGLAIDTEIAKNNRLYAIDVKYLQDKKTIEDALTKLEHVSDITRETQYKALQENLLLIDQKYKMDKMQLESEAFANFGRFEDMKIQRAAETHAEMLRMQKDFMGNAMFNNEQIRQIAAERAAFERKTTLEQTKFGIDQAQTVFAALGAQNKKAFEASKALAVASAVMNTYQGATKALATYPWPFGLIAAAAAVAAGFAQVNAIKSQQYSGKMVGGAVAGAGSYIVGEKGPELFTPGVTGNITPNHQLNSGSTNVNFTIVANDTAGFDELLTSRRGVITQIISDAMLERGQRM